jgi:hypothetical protein
VAWAFWFVDCGARLVELLLLLLLLLLVVVVSLLFVVLCVVLPDDEDDEEEVVLELDVLCVEPGSATARATAPAIPETPTTEVMAFTRARSRRRVRFGWSNIAAPSAWSADRCRIAVHYPWR